MAKRKAVDHVPATPPAAKKVSGSVGILKKVDSPASATKKVVTFPPPAQLQDTLKTFSSNGEVDEVELSNMMSSMETLRGPSLTLWLNELNHNVAALSNHMNQHLDNFVSELLKIKWTDQGDAVSTAFINFITNLVSANARFTRQTVSIIIDNFKGNDRKTDSIVFEKSHAALKSLLSVAPVVTRYEILSQITNKFPIYKLPAYRQICFVSAMLEMMRYVPNSKDEILRLLMEKLIILDAHLSRDFISNAYMIKKEISDDEQNGNAKLDSAVQALDLFMKLMFTFLELETHDDQGQFDAEKSSSIVDSLMKVFSSHLLRTYNILHTQFLYLYLASLSPIISARFMMENWKVFIDPNQPSIIRQTAIAYIASYLSRASYVGVKVVLTYLDKISQWAHAYIRNRESSSSRVDYMHTNLDHHGPFYAACQSIFYVFAFRYQELTASEERMKSLQSMSWQTLVTSHLNPLRVCLPGVVTNFSATARNCQLAYCNSIIERNNRINLPVVGSLSSSDNMSAKPLLLDCFFPFDPYLLEESKVYIQDLYRPFNGQIFEELSHDDDSEEESSDSDDDDNESSDGEDDDNESSDEEDDEAETSDSGIGRKRRRQRQDSSRYSVSSACSRSRQDSVGRLNDLLMQDITAAQTSGF